MTEFPVSLLFHFSTGASFPIKLIDLTVVFLDTIHNPFPYGRTKRSGMMKGPIRRGKCYSFCSFKRGRSISCDYRDSFAAFLCLRVSIKSFWRWKPWGTFTLHFPALFFARLENFHWHERERKRKRLRVFFGDLVGEKHFDTCGRIFGNSTFIMR